MHFLRRLSSFLRQCCQEFHSSPSLHSDRIVKGLVHPLGLLPVFFFAWGAITGSVVSHLMGSLVCRTQGQCEPEVSSHTHQVDHTAVSYLTLCTPL